MADKYRIISDGAITRIYAPSGEELKNVRSLEITHKALGKLEVKFCVFDVEIDILAENTNGR